MRLICALLITFCGINAFAFTNEASRVYLPTSNEQTGAVIEPAAPTITSVTPASLPDGTAPGAKTSGKSRFAFDDHGHSQTNIEVGGLFGIRWGYKVPPANFTKQQLEGNWLDFRISHGYAIRNLVFIGAGTGLDYRKNNAPAIAPPGTPSVLNEFLIPVYLQIRVTVMKTRIAPFIDLKGGASFFLVTPDFPNAVDVGPFGAVHLGGRVYVTKRLSVNLSLGYQFQYMQSYKGIGNYDHYYDLAGNRYETSGTPQIHYIYHFISLTGGISF